VGVTKRMSGKRQERGRAAISDAVKKRQLNKEREEDQHLADLELGKRIRHLRVEILGFDRQADFAERLGVTRGAVGNWEVGKGVKRANLEKISETFNISLVWLATGAGTPVSKPSIDARLELLPPEEYDPLYEHFQAMIDNRLRSLERQKAEAKAKARKR
jgi:transcriptional regulator with XRE-family HTH domain